MSQATNEHSMIRDDGRGHPMIFEVPNDIDHPSDMGLLRWSIMANGIREPLLRRRALIKVAEEAMRLAALEAPDNAEPDAELTAVCGSFLAADADVHVPGISDDSMTAIWPRYYEALERLTDIPALTEAGRQIKAVAAYRAMASVHGSWGGSEEMAALSALADIAGSIAACPTQQAYPDAELLGSPVA